MNDKFPGRAIAYLALLLTVGGGAGCAGEPVVDPPPENVTIAHTTLTPGRTAWARVSGGPGIQRFVHSDAHEASRLNFSAGIDDDRLRVVAFDPNGRRMADDTYGEGSFDRIGLAAGHDDSRTLTRSGVPDGFGCEPASDERVVELAHLEADGGCRWLYSFPDDPVRNLPKLHLAAGVEGTVVVAGTTRQELAFGDVTVGENLPETGGLPVTFVLRLDAATGEVLWHVPLGHAHVEDVAVDLGDRVVVALHTSFAGGWNVQAFDADGGFRWLRTLPTSVESVSVAGSPAGEVVAAGSFEGVFDMVGVPEWNSGASSQSYIVRFRAGSGNVAASRTTGGTASDGIVGVDIDHHGKVVVVGSFFGGTFSIGSYSFATTGLQSRAWGAELTPQLDVVRWARSIGSDVEGEYVGFRDVAYTNNSRAMIAGELNGTIDFGGTFRTGERAALTLRIQP